MSQKVWFITGASRGFGRIWAEAALARGDYVVATARNPEAIADLVERFGDSVLPLPLDVTNTEQVNWAVRKGHEVFGRFDVVLNNSGYAILGAVEECSLNEIQQVFDTNFFGAVRVIQAALPFLRQQGNGHILGTSSVAGVVAGPMIGFYHASKWAFEALYESLSHEVAGFGIKVTLLEPGAYATEFASQASLKVAKTIDAYLPMRQQVFAAGAAIKFGDPYATSDLVLRLVDHENPPLRVFLGTEGMPVALAAFRNRLALWEAWETLSNQAQGESRRQTVSSV